MFRSQVVSFEQPHLANLDGLKLVREVDLEGTMGVLAKIDIMCVVGPHSGSPTGLTGFEIGTQGRKLSTFLRDRSSLPDRDMFRS